MSAITLKPNKFYIFHLFWLKKQLKSAFNSSEMLWTWLSVLHPLLTSFLPNDSVLVAMQDAEVSSDWTATIMPLFRLEVNYETSRVRHFLFLWDYILDFSFCYCHTAEINHLLSDISTNAENEQTGWVFCVENAGSSVCSSHVISITAAASQLNHQSQEPDSQFLCQSNLLTTTD